MIFEDLFYPGNESRRERIYDLKAEIKNIFNNFENAWNNNAKLLNEALELSDDETYSKVKLPILTYDITSDDIGYCIEQINTTLKDADGKIKKLVKDIKLEEYLPKDWETQGIKINDIGDTQLINLGRMLGGGGVSLITAGYLAFYVIKGVTVAAGLISVATGAAVSTAAICGGALLGTVVGAVGFIITDMIVDSITGAVKRKKYNEAIDALEELVEDLKPLGEAANELRSITRSINEGSYYLDETHELCRDEEGFYILVRQRKQKRSACVLNAVQEKILLIPA